MGFATHLGPWLLGTVKNTTGTTAGTIQNIGGTIVAQTNSASFGFAAINSSLTGTAFVLPAGAIIRDAVFYTTTTYDAAFTLKLTMGGSDIYAATTLTGPLAPTLMTAGTSNVITGLLANVGTTDAIVTYTATKGSTLTTGAGTLLIAYIVRGSDGAMYPTASQQ